jgi:hypothetical protein
MNVKARQNIYGNWKCYIGATMTYEAGANKHSAIYWLAEQIKAGRAVSVKSDITTAEVSTHMDSLA